MSRPRPRIPQRKRIFLGCEGDSEVSYGALLGRLAEEPPRVHVHIVARKLQPGAGDPLELVRKSIEIMLFEERRRSPFAVKAVLLDRGTPEKTGLADTLARKSGIHLVWQTPDHEALLLRHLPNCQQRRPPAGASMAALQQEWPEYDKAMPMMGLPRRIGRPEVVAAAGVEPELQEMLTQIGFNLDL